MAFNKKKIPCLYSNCQYSSILKGIHRWSLNSPSKWAESVSIMLYHHVSRNVWSPVVHNVIFCRMIFNVQHCKGLSSFVSNFYHIYDNTILASFAHAMLLFMGTTCVSVLTIFHSKCRLKENIRWPYNAKPNPSQHQKKYKSMPVLYTNPRRPHPFNTTPFTQ